MEKMIMKKITQSCRLIFLAATLMVSLPGHAFVLGGTRVLLNGNKAATIPVISSKNDGVLLVQAKITQTDEGKGRVADIVVSPPVSRLERQGQNMLRLMMLNPSAYPADRESVFYLSVAGLPSSNPLSPDRGKVSGGVVLGTGVIIKVFYRPDALPETTDATWSSIKATRVPGGISISNPTPFHITFVSLKVDNQPVQFSNAEPAMLPPFSHQFYGTRSVAKKTLTWGVVNDLGGTLNGQTAIH